MIKETIIRGTTPTICFHLPFDLEEIEEMWLTLAQRGRDIITKEKEDMEYDNGTFSVTLSQDETLRLDARQKTEIQLRMKFVTGHAVASEEKPINVDDILKDGVI